MKKNVLFSVIMLLFATFILPSCSKDKDEPSKSDIVGTWQLSEVSSDGVDFATWMLETTTATFNSNGTYSGRGAFGNGTGTWKQSGKTITCYVDGMEYVKYEVIELASTTCTLKMTMGTSSIWIKCIKK